MIPISSTRQIILASKSSARKTLLAEAGLDFTVKASGLDETPFKELYAKEPETLAVTLAREKAKVVAKQFPQAIIIAADTVVVVGEGDNIEILGQAEDVQQASFWLQKLSGTTHTVMTGIAVLSGETLMPDLALAKTQVTFHPISDATLSSYLASNLWQGKAGGYGVQDKLAQDFIKSIAGDETNVWGLAMPLLAKMLSKI